MPYFITESNADCSGWAVEKDDGEVLGCHGTKQDAIDQMVALSLAEGMEPGGERALPENYRPAVGVDVPEGRACGNCVFYDESRLNEDGVRVWCSRWDDWVRGDHYCNAWRGRDDSANPYDDEGRQVDLTVPDYIRSAAAQGLQYHRDGLSGDGIAARTVSEAAAMERGEVSEDKVVRASAWAARHRPDLDAAGARPGEDGYPTPGAVAHLLWGIPTGARYSDAVGWFDRKAEQIRDERTVMETIPVQGRTNSNVEFRAVTGQLDGEGRTFVGYAAMFDVPSEPLPFVERIARGAFDRTLRNRKRDVRLYVNHDSNMVLASKRSGTLRLSEDDRGLRVEADLPDTTYANDLRELMRSNVVDKMSFGFQVPRGGDTWSDDGRERTLRQVELFEVSVVTGFPAYDQTSAAVRSLDRLSARTGMPVDELTQALDALADGQELDATTADMLMNAIMDSMPPKPEPDPTTISLLQKKHALVGKSLW